MTTTEQVMFSGNNSQRDKDDPLYWQMRQENDDFLRRPTQLFTLPLLSLTPLVLFLGRIYFIFGNSLFRLSKYWQALKVNVFRIRLKAVSLFVDTRQRLVVTVVFTGIGFKSILYGIGVPV
jgi:hypothetical protein